jgi:antitoxin component of MazEF toxin-antitoxin module
MTKLQEIKRKDETVVYSIYIPAEVIEQLHWEKGEELTIESNELGNSVCIHRKESKME